MSKMLRRYEPLLPLRFNDGRMVPDDLLADALLELEARFGVVSCETQTICGQWRHQGKSYRDDLIRLFGDVADDPGHRAFFLDFKARMMERFRQVDLGMTTYLIEVL